MKHIRLTYTALLTGIFLFLFSCENANKKQLEVPAVNLRHLMHLYEEVDLPGDVRGGIVHIYSEYPDYAFEIEPNEGYTCVDDVARAMMIDKLRLSNDQELQSKYNRMTEFLLYMQAENGWFYNFIWHDLSINKTYRTSLAQPDWWSWRAFWALASYNKNDEITAKKVEAACARLAENIFQTYLDQPPATDTIEGIVVPEWLPLGAAGDQAALLILGLEAYHQNINQDKRILKLIEKLADGLLLTQKGDARNFPFGAFLSWQNLWHAYGNSQSYALLKAGQLLNRDDYIKSALLEIENFYPYLIKENFPAFFSLSNKAGHYEILELQQFPNIAYGFRPMIWACMQAFLITGEDKYAEQALKISSWFTGNNVAGRQMYDPATGRCFDGIISTTEVNMNSGAESTIEALLSMQVLHQLN
jgi:hypothetical protein